jgi:hypothetical protein
VVPHHLLLEFQLLAAVEQVLTQVEQPTLEDLVVALEIIRTLETEHRVKEILEVLAQRVAVGQVVAVAVQVAQAEVLMAVTAAV